MKQVENMALSLLISGYIRIHDIDPGRKLYGDIVHALTLYVENGRNLNRCRSESVRNWDLNFDALILEIFEGSSVGNILLKAMIPDHSDTANSLLESVRRLISYN